MMTQHKLNLPFPATPVICTFKNHGKILVVIFDVWSKSPRVMALVDKVLSDMYVDDLATSCDRIEESQTLIRQLCNIMKSGGFAMKKWASNGPAALSDLPVEALWLTGIEWDDPLPAEINVQRALVPVSRNQVVRYELHVFGDAAEAAYKAVAHLLTQISDGVPQVRFVLAKACVTPIKRWSLLRLELMASLLAARLKAYITKETFTANRVQEIIRQIKPSQWRYVPAVDNPADRLSGGCTLERLLKDHL
ncbi:hypothetical protein T4D_6102 [Trichinella pseudospiralis]|uniref:Uncharacterized protein n=1 Tax=Trichinella pseudospiralis TaxID=6337 RepID=A0A0V1F426_TRIPS|nr:hypothetical protein T4D_6102 [Trichinella pseudospiralis]